MKKIIPVMLLAGLIMSATAQPTETRLTLPLPRILPSYPLRANGGEMINIAWRQDSLNNISAVSAILYVYDTLYHWHVYEKTMIKTGDTVWKTSLAMPPAAGFIAYKFRIGDRSDNNNDIGYFTMVYRKDGRYMPGAEAGYGLLRSPHYEYGVPYYFERFSISDTATYMWLSNEILRNRGGALPLVLPYLKAYNKFEPEKAEKETGRALHFLLQQKTAGEEPLLKAYLVSKFYGKDSSLTDSIRTALLTAYPNGALARKEAYEKVQKAKTMEDRMTLSLAFVGKFPPREEEAAMNEILDIRYYPVYRNILAIAIAEKKPEIAFGQMENLTILNLPDLYYKAVEIPYDDWKTMDAKTAYPYSEALYRRMLQFYAHRPATKWYYAPSEWKDYCDKIFANYFRLHARILSELGKDEEALALAERTQKSYLYGSSDLNQTEAILLQRAGKGKALDTVLRASVRVNQVTPVMITMLKQQYLKSHKNEDGFDAWLNSMKDERTRQLAKENIIKSRLSLPAPDFSLLSADGRQVSLKSLRGKIVVLDFWATWCAPCKAAMAGMNMVRAKYSNDTDVVFLFIDNQERQPDYEEKGQAFLKGKGYPFTVLYDAGEHMDEVYNAYSKALHTSGIPLKVVIDGNGILRYPDTGYMGSPSGLADEIELMIGLARQDALVSNH